MKRAIQIFPDTSAYGEIEAFRRRFDGLSSLIAAHVTVVFPFESDISDEELIRHCEQQVLGVSAYAFQAAGPTRSVDDHYWLPITPAPPQLAQLQRVLGSGPLAGLSSLSHEYCPHITIARPPLASNIEQAVAEMGAVFPALFEARSIIVERIDPDGRSQLIHEAFPEQSAPTL